MAKRIEDIFNAQSLKDYYETTKQQWEAANGVNLARLLFPLLPQASTKVEFSKNGVMSSPMKLKPSTLDANVDKRAFMSGALLKDDMAFFREKMALNETHRRDINEVIKNGSEEKLKMVMGSVYESVAGTGGFLASPEVTQKYMGFKALATGKIPITIGGVVYEYDYDLASNQKETLIGAAAWTQTETATPLQDMDDQISDCRTAKMIIEVIIMNPTTFRAIKNTKEVKDKFTNLKIDLTDKNLKEYMENRFGLPVISYMDTYKSDGGSNIFYVDDYKVIYCRKEMGKMRTGPTPESEDIESGFIGAGQSFATLDNGASILVTMTPVVPRDLELGISLFCLPTGEEFNNLFIHTVA